MARRYRTRTPRRLASLPALVLVLAVAAVTIFAIANTISGVNPASLNSFQLGITPTMLEPQLCRTNGIAPSTIRTNSAPNGDTASQLILGGNGANTLHGRGGDDCVVGGNGGDHLYGDAGNDVCVGGGGNDILDASCEVQSQ